MHEPENHFYESQTLILRIQKGFEIKRLVKMRQFYILDQENRELPLHH